MRSVVHDAGPRNIRLVLPDNPAAVVILAAARHDRQGLAQGLADRLAEAGLAVAVPGIDFDDGLLHEAPEKGRRLARELADLGEWASEYVGAGLLPLAILGTSEAAVPAAGAAGILGEKLDALVVCTADPRIVETDLESVEAPTLFLSDGDDPLDLKFTEALAMTMPLGSRAIPIRHHELPLALSLEWLKRCFVKFALR